MYAASDLAGTMKLQYDVSSKNIRMPCTARLDINFILKALQEGAGRVLIVGCHPSDCASAGIQGDAGQMRFGGQEARDEARTIGPDPTGH